MTKTTTGPELTTYLKEHTGPLPKLSVFLTNFTVPTQKLAFLKMKHSQVL